MVPPDWDLAPKCVCGPNFTSYLIGDSAMLLATRMGFSREMAMYTDQIDMKFFGFNI